MIIFNGNDLSSDFKVLDIKRSILPPSIVSTSQIVGRSGSFFFYKQFGEVTIPVEIMLLAKNHVELRAKVRDLAAKLDTDKPEKLIFKDEPDKYINAVISDSSELDEIASTGKGTLNFLCPDPYWYAINDDIITKTSVGTYTFTRKGTAESYPLIEIVGSGSGTITLSNGKDSITYQGSLNSSSKLVLDSDLMTAYIDNSITKTSAIDKLNNLDFLVLSPGENKITVAVSGISLNSVTIKCRSRWK